MDMGQQGYQIPGQQLRWRVAQLRAQGLPFEVEDLGGGNYLIIVQQPADADPFAYQPQARRRRQSTGAPPYIMLAGVVVVVAVAGYIAYAVMGGASNLPRDVDPDMRQLFARTMDAIGSVLLLALVGAIVWMARPLLGSLGSLAGSLAAAAGKLRRDK